MSLLKLLPCVYFSEVPTISLNKMYVVQGTMQAGTATDRAFGPKHQTRPSGTRIYHQRNNQKISLYGLISHLTHNLLT